MAEALAHGSGVAEICQSGTPELGSACGLAQEQESDMRKPLGPLVWGCRGRGGAGTRLSGSAVAVLVGAGRSGCARAGNWVQRTCGACARHNTPFGALCRCSCREGGLRANLTSATEREGRAGAHRGLGSGRSDVQRRRRRGPVAGIDVAHADGSLQGCSVPTDPSRKSVRDLWRQARG